MEKKTGTKRLTCCDWVVLVVLLSLAASLVNPALSQAVDEKRLVDLADGLQSMRAGLQLYKAAHGGRLPGQRLPGQAVTPAAFVAALTEQPGPDGQALLRQIPANPYVTDAAAARTVTCVNDPDARPDGTEGTAWWFNAATGEFCACDSAFHTNY